MMDLDLSLDEIIKKKGGDRTRGRAGVPGRVTVTTKPGLTAASATFAAGGRVTKPKARAPQMIGGLKNQSKVVANTTRQNPVKITPTTRFAVRNDKPFAPFRKAEVHSKGGFVVTVKNDRKTASVDITKKKFSVSADPADRSPRSSPKKGDGPFEIRIRNDRAIEPPSFRNNSSSSNMMVPEAMPAMNQMMSPHMSIPTTGLATTSSHFRTPMAVMDLYAGRYGRPTLEPYRPPPMIQQFYRSLAESTAMGQIPPHHLSTPAIPHVPSSDSSSYKHHHQQEGKSVPIRKPYDY